MFFTKKYKKLLKHNNDLVKENNLILRQILEKSFATNNTVAQTSSPAINNTDYLIQYKILHTENPDYGTSSIMLKEPIIKYITQFNAREILDYGCGKGVLSDELEKELSVKCFKYDPCIPEYSIIPENKKFDLVICTDVLEHIPSQDLNKVLCHMSFLGKKFFLNISCRLAGQILPNGQNAHCTVFPPRWWYKKLSSYFKHIQEIDCEDITAVSFIADNENTENE